MGIISSDTLTHTGELNAESDHQHYSNFQILLRKHYHIRIQI